MENDLFAFIHKLRLIYRFTGINENQINPDQSLLKPILTWTPRFTKNKEFENLIRNLSNISFYNAYKQGNIKKNLHLHLNDLILLATSMKTIIKEVDKGIIVTIMSPEFYWNMSKKHLIIESYKKVIQNSWVRSWRSMAIFSKGGFLDWNVLFG